MSRKDEAFKMHREGKSYNEIAKYLKIGKTTAYDYVKEIKLSNKGFGLVLNDIENIVPNSSELAPNGRSEQKPERKLEKDISISKNKEEVNKTIVPNVPTKQPAKSFSGNDLLKMKFETLSFTGKFLELIGKPEKHFSGIIWGLPKGGKSNLSIRFADYLQEYFGDVLYVAAEEGKSVSMQEKIIAINGSNVNFYPSKNRDDIKEYVKNSKASFVFIDSINVAGIDDAFLEDMKQENPDKSFVAIVQATKGGNFKGEQSLEHNCDFVIKVVSGIAYHKGRFGPESEIPIFDSSLYEKNETRKTTKQVDKIVEEPLKKNIIIPFLPPTQKKEQVIIPESIKEYIKNYSFSSKENTDKNLDKKDSSNETTNLNVLDLMNKLFID